MPVYRLQLIPPGGGFMREGHFILEAADDVARDGLARAEARKWSNTDFYLCRDITGSVPAGVTLVPGRPQYFPDWVGWDIPLDQLPWTLLDATVDPSRPSLRALNALLRRRSALIVHFSGLAGGSGNTMTPDFYPDDLLAVEAGLAQGGLCCSVVCPGDTFDLGSAPQATGNIGLIIRPLEASSILDAAAHDLGSPRLPDGSRPRNPNPLTIDDLEATLSPPGTWNQWDLANYAVAGVFVAQPGAYRTQPTNSEPGGFGHDSFADVGGKFPSYPVYTFANGRVAMVHPAEDAAGILRSLYP